MAVLTTADLISKAKYQLFRGFPFFSYLVDNLTIKEMKEIPTMGVDGKGNVYYNNDFVQKICPNNDIKTLIGVLTHEALHLVFEHPKRGKGRKEMVGNVSLYNIAGDIYINNIILLNKNDMLCEMNRERIFVWYNVKLIKDITNYLHLII